jgi:hypothetical protein
VVELIELLKADGKWQDPPEGEDPTPTKKLIPLTVR